MILKAMAENGSLSAALRSRTVSSAPGLKPITGGRSTGLGRYQAIASSTGWTPLFLKAAPVRTGTNTLLSTADGGADLIGRDLEVFEVLLQELLVDLGARIEQLVAPLVGRRGVLGGDLDGVPDLAVVVGPDVGLHLDQIDDALEFGLGADRQLQRDRTGLQANPDRLHRASKAGADAVHLVDEADTGNSSGRPGATLFGLRLTPATALNTATAPSSYCSDRPP
jgi:hypothetical protein